EGCAEKSTGCATGGLPMKIRYANSMKDLIAFNHHYTATSPAQRRAAIVLRWALPSLLLFAAVVLSLLGEWQAAGLFCVAPAVVGYFIFPIIWKRSLANALRSAYREGDNKGVLGPHELELAPPDLIERTPVNENRRWLGAIERIETTPSHSFIFL